MDRCIVLDNDDCLNHTGCLWKNKECISKYSSCREIVKKKDPLEFILNNKKYSKDFIRNLLNIINSSDISNFKKNIINFIDSKDVLEHLEKLYPNNQTDIISIVTKLYSSKFRETLENMTLIKDDVDDLNREVIKIIRRNPDNLIYGFCHFLLQQSMIIQGRKSSIYSEKNVFIVDTLKSIGINSYKKIVKHFKNFNVIPKTSASNSIIISAEINKLPTNSFIQKTFIPKNSKFILKIFNKDILKNPNLDTEINIYNQLSQLVKYDITPNILLTSLAGTLKDFDTEFYSNFTSSALTKLTLGREISKVNAEMNLPLGAIWNNTGIIITGFSEETLNQAFPNLTSYELQTVLFQIYYTLYVFEKLRISHGDIHTNNIFINTIDPIEYTFIIEGKIFTFEINKLVKIYDFDHSMIEKESVLDVGINKMISIQKTINPIREDSAWGCRQFGECNIFNRNLDHVIFKENFEESIKKLLKKNSELDKLINFAYGNFNMNYNTIRETYDDLLRPTSKNFKKEYLNEFNRIYNRTQDAPYTSTLFNDELLRESWSTYRIMINRKYAHILRNFLKSEPLNHLWIPDTIIKSYIEILNHSYFKSLESTKISKRLFTIDNKIKI